MNYISLSTTDTVRGIFSITGLGSGAIDPDSTPTGFLLREGVIDETVTISVGEVGSGLPGLYEFSGNFADFDDGNWVFVVVEYRVSSKTYYEVVLAGRVSSESLHNTPDDYEDGELGALIGKLDVGAPEDPVIVIPAPSVDPSVCRVYGYLKTIDNRPASSLTLTAQLTPESTIAKITGYFVSKNRITFYTNADGRIVDGDGNFYVELLRTDSLFPSGGGWTYLFTCEDLELEQSTELTTETFDFSEIVGS